MTVSVLRRYFFKWRSTNPFLIFYDNSVIALLIFVFSFLIFGFNINQIPLRNWDEAWYAQIIKEMASGVHGYLFPFWNGQYYLDKPPLYFWLSLPVVKIFGLGEWQMRFVSVLAASLSVLLIYLIAKKVFNQRVAVFSSLSFVLMGQTIERLSRGNLDGLLIFSILFATYLSLFLAKKNYYLYLSISIFCIIFSKSWLYLPFTFLLLLLLNPKKFWVQITKSSLIAIVLSSIWYFLGYLKFGTKFFSWYLFLSGGINMISFKPELIISLIRDQLFFIPLILIALFKSKNKVPIFLFALSIFYLFLLQFYLDNYGWYLLPVYPLLAVITGVGSDYLFSHKLKLFLILFGFQIIIPLLIYLAPDRSDISYRLGNFLKTNTSPADEVYLYDPDFSTVLYYSNLNHLNVVSNSDPKPYEWWVINKNSLSKNLSNSFILAPDSIKNLPKPKKIISAPDSFLLYQY